MPLEIQPTGMKTKIFILFCVYKFKSRQGLVNGPLEEKKDKDNQSLHDKEERRLIRRAGRL